MTVPLSPLARRLKEASRSGAYRAADAAALERAAREAGLAFTRIDFTGAKDKAAILGRMAQALAFPDWFGGNWDALEDCLRDLSWRPAAGHVLWLQGLAAGEESAVLLDVLATAAEAWAADGTPFLAFVESAGAGAPLPPMEGLA